MSDWKNELLSKARNDQEALRAGAAIRGIEEFIADMPNENFTKFEISQTDNRWLVTATADSGEKCSLGFEQTA